MAHGPILSSTKFHWNIAVLIYLHTICGSLCATVVELSRYSRNHMTHEAENISMGPFLEKVCQPL